MYRVDMYYTVKTLTERGYSQRRIARELGIHRRTVKKIITDLENGLMEPTPVRKQKKLDRYTKQIQQFLQEGWSAELVHRWLSDDQQIPVSYPTVARFVAALKVPEVYVPMICGPGEEAQVDFGYLGRFRKDKKMVKVWCFAMTLSHSRYSWWQLVTDQRVATFLRCHIHAFEFFAGVPRSVKIDNLKAGVIHPSFYEPVYQRHYAELLAHYGAGPVTARPRRPQDKGKVESAIKYVKNNFLPPHRRLTYRQLEQKLAEWTNRIANKRTHGTTRKVPWALWQQVERKALQALPAQRCQLWDLERRKVSRFGHVAYRYNYYSVPSEHVGRQVSVHCNESLVNIYWERRKIATHLLNSGTGQYISREEHRPAYKRKKSRQDYEEAMAAIGEHALAFMEALEQVKPRHWHEMCAGILQLSKSWPAEAVNQSCRRATYYRALSYRKVKTILEEQLWKLPIEESQSRCSVGSFGHGHSLGIYDQLDMTVEAPYENH